MIAKISAVLILCHCFGQLFAAENMKMNVLHGLTSVLAAVIYNTVSVCQFHYPGDLWYRFKNLCHVDAVFCCYLICATDMSLGNHKNVNGSLRINILECIYVFVLVYL